MSSGGGYRGFEFPLLHSLHEWVEKAAGTGGFILPASWLFAGAIGGTVFFNFLAPLQSIHNWDWVFVTGPIWMPVLVGRFAMLRYIQMKRSYSNYQSKFVLLELRLPREVLKTPQAMETVLSSLNVGPGEGTWWKKWWMGKTRPWWSLEIASIDGNIRFFIYTREGMRRGTESFFYAQYPEIEIIEAKDYSRMREVWDTERFTMDAFEFKEGGKAPFPIKTYVDYGLDKPGAKVETTVDPLAQVLELLGSIGPGEQIWLQMIIRVAKNERFRGAKNDKGKAYSIKDEAVAEVEAIRTKTLSPTGAPNPTEVQKERMASIERNMGKLLFDVGMRVIYSAPKGQGKGMGGPLLNMWKPLNSSNYNSIDPAGQWGAKYNDYPWEDMGGKRKQKDNHEAAEFYRYRSFFHPPYRGHWMTMSTEELATIFHFPSSIVKTPSLERITSARSAPPANLPQ